MAPPPPPAVAPSPRRFILNQSHAPQITPGNRPLSAHGLDQDTGSGPRPSQFARAPRFHVSATRLPSPPPRSPSLTRPHFAIPGIAVTRREDVQDAASNDDEDDEMLDNIPFGAIMPTADTPSSSIEEPRKVPVFMLPPSPKRRRIEDELTLTQQTPPRFMLQPEASQTSTSDNTIGTTNRSAFLRPSIPPPESESPLPDAFSPHRRGHKFVAGGLAAEMQSWMIEEREAAMQSRRGRGYLHGEDYVYRIKAGKLDGEEPVFVEGRVAGASVGRAMLVSAKDEIKVGDVIGIRAPSWEVMIDGKEWIVGYDWRVIKQ